MAYIGPSSSDVYKSMATQTITGDGSAQSFSLNQSVSDSSSTIIGDFDDDALLFFTFFSFSPLHGCASEAGAPCI